MNAIVTPGQIIVDANCNPLVRGSIVGVSDTGHWSPFQGLVLDQFSDIEDDGYCVAVFFNLEVSFTYFNYWGSADKERGITTIFEWDQQYGKQCKDGDIDFLFINDEWKKCPRVRFFRPNELVVQTEWELKYLVNRVFRHNCHHYCLSAYDLKPSLYLCWLEGCKNTASKIALFNVWGTVYPICVCEDCFPKTNGWLGDDLPRIKEPILLVDSSIAPKRKK